MKNISIIERRLKESGYKLTEQRKAILEVLEANHGHFTAQEIFEMVRKKQEGINFSTIYRNLEILSAIEIINKLNINSGISHYELNDMEHSHHHHIICKACGSMKEIDICPYEKIESKCMEEMGFEPTEHKFEIYGYCSKCREK